MLVGQVGTYLVNCKRSHKTSKTEKAERQKTETERRDVALSLCSGHTVVIIHTSPARCVRPSSRVLWEKKHTLHSSIRSGHSAFQLYFVCTVSSRGDVELFDDDCEHSAATTHPRASPTHSSVFAVPRGIQVISRTLTYDAPKHFSFLSRLWLGFLTFFRHIVMDNSSRETNK